MSQFRLRAALASTPEYVPGKPPRPAAGVESFKLSSNEHHMAPLPQVTQAMVEAVTNPAVYPDPAVAGLTEQMAAHLGVEPSHIVFGAGGSEVLSATLEITLEPGTNAVYPWPSFEMYAQVGALTGAEQRQVPLTADYRIDVDGILGAIDDDTRLVILCSPNNPTGPVLHQDELDRLLAGIPDDLIVLLDEAYIEFANDPATADGLAALPEHRNLIVLRTFSKAHGLAGLRVGYGIADPALIGELRKAIAPFSVNMVAQAAAAASLAAVADVEVRAKEVAAARDALVAGLREQGWDVPDAQGNFVWLPAFDDAEAVEAACKAAGLAVRRLPGGVRISIGPDTAMARVLQVAAGLESAHRKPASSTAGTSPSAEGAGA